MIYLGSDHGGYKLKEKVKEWLKEWNLSYQDLGPPRLDPQDDYPQFAFAVSEKVANEAGARGILFCRSASGVVIAANKVKNIRAAAAYDSKMAGHIREHNDTNILAISADWTGESQVKEIIKIWLNTKFSKEERHRRRIKQISEKEERICECEDCTE